MQENDWDDEIHIFTGFHLLRVFIRSKLDYGFIVYNFGSRTVVGALEPIVNECLKMITGCFKFTPVERLKVIANELPLTFRIDLLTLKYYIKTRSQDSNPAHGLVTSLNDRLLFRNRRLTPTLAIRAWDMIESMNIETNFVCPEFSYTLLNIDIPTWKVKSLKINDELSSLTKAVTPHEAFQQLYCELVSVYTVIMLLSLYGWV